jgi:glycosyltransferase involved in cell wall biosynthesis
MLVRRERLDFIYNPTPQTMYLEVPYITTIWDLQHRRQPQFPEVSAEGAWEAREQEFNRVLRRAACIITGTRAGQEELERFYGIPGERVEILPHPTPQSALEAGVRDPEGIRLKYGLKRDFLLYPAQFWPHKNHVGLLRAVQLLQQQGTYAPDLVLVGSDQGNLPYVQQVSQDLNLRARVHILGFIPRTDLLDLYAAAQALVYVTYFGPENLPPLEAFALGCPVIASRVAGADEQLCDAALLVDPDSEADIAQAITRLYQDPALRTKLIERGRERAQRFTPERFVARVVGLLNRYAAQRRCWAAA